MTSQKQTKWVLAALMAMPLAMATGCAREVSHTETDKPGWFGGRTHEETTVTKNPDGTTDVSHEKKSTNP